MAVFWARRTESRIRGHFSHVQTPAFSENDTGPFGVSLKVFLARCEAPLSCFDLLHVVCLTYLQCTFQTMHALRKEEVDGVKWCFTKKRETQPLQLGPNTQF